MATNAADPMEEDTKSRTTLERKRPHDAISRDDASNAGSAHSTPRKRAKHAGKLGHQDVRDFVPVGASFSTSVVPVDESQDSGDDGSQSEISPKAERSSNHEFIEVTQHDVAEQEKALVEGRRLVIGDLPPDTTKEDLNQFFNGYTMYVIVLTSRSLVLTFHKARIYGFLILWAKTLNLSLMHRTRIFPWTVVCPS